MNERPRPVQQMLKQLEVKFFTVIPIVNEPGKLMIQCKHCNLELTFNDDNHDEAQHAAALYLAHLKKLHKNLLTQSLQVEIDKL